MHALELTLLDKVIQEAFNYKNVNRKRLSYISLIFGILIQNLVGGFLWSTYHESSDAWSSQIVDFAFSNIYSEEVIHLDDQYKISWTITLEGGGELPFLFEGEIFFIDDYPYFSPIRLKYYNKFTFVFEPGSDFEAFSIWMESRPNVYVEEIGIVARLTRSDIYTATLSSSASSSLEGYLNLVPEEALAGIDTALVGYREHDFTGLGTTGTPLAISPFFRGKLLENNWRNSPLGPVYDVRSPWIYHPGFGWMYFVTFKNSDYFFYNEILGWCLFLSDSPNYFIQIETNSWFYVGKGRKDYGWLYSFENNAWMNLKK